MRVQLAQVDKKPGRLGRVGWACKCGMLARCSNVLLVLACTGVSSCCSQQRAVDSRLDIHYQAINHCCHIPQARIGRR